MEDKGFMSFLFKGQKPGEKKDEQAKTPTTSLPPVAAKGSEPSNEEVLRSLAAIREALSPSFKPEPPPPRSQPPPVDQKTKERQKDRKLYEVLLSGLYDGVLIFDAKGSSIGSNRRAEQFFGYDAKELWGMMCDQLIPALGIRVLTKIKSYAESGRFTVVNASCTRKDKSSFPAEIAISRINLLNEGDLILSIRNLERREKARQRHEMEIEALRWAGAGILVCNAQGMIEYANPATLKMLRLHEEKDILKRFIGEFCTSYEGANALLQTPSENSTWLGKMELRTADDHNIEVLAVAAATDAQREGKPDIIITLMPLPLAIKT